MTDDYTISEKILLGQTAIVTGANSGIGTGIAKELGAAKANVVVNRFLDI